MDPPSPYALPLTAAELVAQYDTGSRTFQWAQLAHADLERANLAGADLCDATLIGANLTNADLTGAVLQGANLAGANLNGANLSDANLRWADLSGASLRRSNLNRATLQGTLLQGADFTGASLSATTAQDVTFDDVCLAGVCLGQTRFINTKLGPLCSLDVTHEDPSYVDLRTLLRSRGDSGLEAFIRRTGIDPALAARWALVARNADDEELNASTQHIFLVHHSRDANFARRLHDALDRLNSSSYLKPWIPATLSACYAHKVVLLCSKASLGMRAPLRGLPLPRPPRRGFPPFVVAALDTHVACQVGRLTVGGNPSVERQLWSAIRARAVADFASATTSHAFDAEAKKILHATKRPLDV